MSSVWRRQLSGYYLAGSDGSTFESCQGLSITTNFGSLAWSPWAVFTNVVTPSPMTRPQVGGLRLRLGG
jgi:hypothetical protein